MGTLPSQIVVNMNTLHIILDHIVQIYTDNIWSSISYKQTRKCRGTFVLGFVFRDNDK